MSSLGRPGFTEKTAWARSLASPLRDFLRTESGSAVVLLGAVVAALVWVNVDASSYHSVWTTTLSIDIRGHGVSQDLARPRHQRDLAVERTVRRRLSLRAHRATPGSPSQHRRAPPPARPRPTSG